MKFNWADVAVQYLQDLREKGYYDQHVQKWKMRNSSEGIKEESTDMNEDKAPKMTPLSHYSSHQGAESMSYFGSADLQPIKAAGEHLKKQLQDAKEKLETAKEELQAARILQAGNVRVTPVVVATRKKLRDAIEELETLGQSESQDVKRGIQLNVKIETLKEMLADLGFPHSEYTPDDVEVDITCQRVSVCYFCASTIRLEYVHN